MLRNAIFDELILDRRLSFELTSTTVCAKKGKSFLLHKATMLATNVALPMPQPCCVRRQTGYFFCAFSSKILSIFH